LVLRSDAPLSETLTRLERAIAAKGYSTPDRQSPGFFRLGGNVGPDQVVVTARPYVTPGIPAGYGAMTLEFEGRVIPVPGGSEVRGIVTAPVRVSTVVFLVVALAVSLVLGLRSDGASWPSLLFLVIGSVAISFAWAWAIRHNQRMALRNAREFARIVQAVLEGR
ncbi:MAG TPA: hypothetical protein VHS36_05430, partial [Candidatus Limnocylindrales bacterium]|nr:hypothetical protein [Candidatus Limnocylindrales bacterium]